MVGALSGLQVPAGEHAHVREALKQALGEAGLPLVAALPHNPLISSVRLDEICAALGARVISGGRGQRDLTVDQARAR